MSLMDVHPDSSLRFLAPGLSSMSVSLICVTSIACSLDWNNWKNNQLNVPVWSIFKSIALYSLIVTSMKFMTIIVTVFLCLGVKCCNDGWCLSVLNCAVFLEMVVIPLFFYMSYSLYMYWKLFSLRKPLPGYKLQLLSPHNLVAVMLLYIWNNKKIHWIKMTNHNNLLNEIVQFCFIPMFNL